MYADTVEPAYLGSLSADRAARSQQIYLLHKNVSKKIKVLPCSEFIRARNSTVISHHQLTLETNIF